MPNPEEACLYLRFREADPTYLSAFTSLLARTMRLCFARPELGIPPEFFDRKYFSDQITQGSYIDQLTPSDRKRAWVCQTIDDEMVGALTSVSYATHVEIPKLYVAPEWASLGIGSLLVNLARAQWGDGRRYGTYVLQYNEAGLQFWQKKFGFEIEGGVKAGYDFLPEDQWPAGSNPAFWFNRLWRPPFKE